MDLLARPDKNHLFGNHCDMSVTTPLSRYLEMGSNAGFGCDFMLFKKHHSYEVNARCSSRISNSLLRFRFRDTFKRSLVSPLHQLKNSIPGDGTKIVLPVTPGLKLGILILSHRLTRFYRYVSVELKFKERKEKDFFFYCRFFSICDMRYQFQGSSIFLIFSAVYAFNENTH